MATAVGSRFTVNGVPVEVISEETLDDGTYAVHFKLTEQRCPECRVHPLSSDYYVQCELLTPHEGFDHANDGVTWTDGSEFAL